jgi:uncharacterized protein (DUF1778 family)
MPAKQRVRRDDPTVTEPAQECRRDRGEQAAVVVVNGRSVVVALEDAELVAEHHDLEVFGPSGANGEHRERREDSVEEAEHDRDDGTASRLVNADAHDFGTHSVDRRDVVAVQWPYSVHRTEGPGMPTQEKKRRRSERLEVRTTPEERAVIDRAVAVSGTDLTEFVVTSLTLAARRVLADRTEFVLDDEARGAWEAVNRRRARDLAGLRALMARESPFVDE